MEILNPQQVLGKLKTLSYKYLDGVHRVLINPNIFASQPIQMGVLFIGTDQVEK